ncbi:MAG TPA: hypothetical protein VFZ62_02810 [Candidatus Saccharimonadales bacterium]
MHKTQKMDPKKTRKSLYISLAVTLGILAALAGWGSGTIQYGIAAVRCMGNPIPASNFMAGRSYYLPGDYNHGPSPFYKYYCSEEDAKAAGYRHS